MSFKIDNLLKEFEFESGEDKNLHDDFKAAYAAFIEKSEVEGVTEEELEKLDDSLVELFNELHEIEDPEDKAKIERELHEVEARRQAKEKVDIINERVVEYNKLVAQMKYDEAIEKGNQLLIDIDNTGELHEKLKASIEDVKALKENKVNWTPERLAKIKQQLLERKLVTYAELDNLKIPYLKGRTFYWGGLKFVKRFFFLQYEVREENEA